MERKLSQELITEFEMFLVNEEKSNATIEKYIRDIKTFFDFIKEKEVNKFSVIKYKNMLLEQGYAIRSINSMLASLNSILKFAGWTECVVKNVKQQKQVYCEEDRELTKKEYMRLLDVSKNKEQLNLIMQTICATGIRISELKYFTVETVIKGKVTVKCKNKIRVVLIPKKLKKILLMFVKKHKIGQGYIFITRGGNPVDRSNIWTQMKKLCKTANVKPSKVFPHNLRKLFAITFYTIEKDIAKLADILGHSHIETTRIYIMTTGVEHRRKIERLGLVI